jgi:hypothetical protein
MASYLNHGSNDGNGDDTDRSLTRRMKKLGKSKPIFEESTEESDASTEEEEETRKGERRKSKSKSNSSRYRSRSTKR